MGMTGEGFALEKTKPAARASPADQNAGPAPLRP